MTTQNNSQDESTAALSVLASPEVSALAAAAPPSTQSSFGRSPGVYQMEESPSVFTTKTFQRCMIAHLFRCPDLVRLRAMVTQEDFLSPIHKALIVAAKDVDRSNAVDILTPELLAPPLKVMLELGSIMTGEKGALNYEFEAIYALDLTPQYYLEQFREYLGTMRLRVFLRSVGEYDLPAMVGGLREICENLPHLNARTSSLRRISELMGMQFPDTHRILHNGYLTKGDSLAICGAPGLGKSRLARQLAFDTVLGRSFIGMETNGTDTRWLFIQLEDSNQRLQSEIRAVLSDPTLTSEQRARLDEQIAFHTLESDLDGFLQVSTPGAKHKGSTSDTRAEDAISAMITEADADVVVFDCFARFASGDINADGEMLRVATELLRITRKGNPLRLPIFVHHARTGREAAAGATGYDRSNHGRNSKALFGMVRAQINIAPGSPDNNGTLVIASGKCNNAEEFSPFAITLDRCSLRYEVDATFDMAAWDDEVSGGGTRKTPKTVDDLLELIPLTGRVSKNELMESIGPAHGIPINCVGPLVDKLLRESPARIYQHAVPRERGRAELFISRHPESEEAPAAVPE